MLQGRPPGANLLYYWAAVEFGDHTNSKSPLYHLRQWRIVRAAARLRELRPVKMATIAALVGYVSESAFGKAFKRVIGTSPREYREHFQRQTDEGSLPASNWPDLLEARS